MPRVSPPHSESQVAAAQPQFLQPSWPRGSRIPAGAQSLSSSLPPLADCFGQPVQFAVAQYLGIDQSENQFLDGTFAEPVDNLPYSARGQATCWLHGAVDIRAAFGLMP